MSAAEVTASPAATSSAPSGQSNQLHKIPQIMLGGSSDRSVGMFAMDNNAIGWQDKFNHKRSVLKEEIREATWQYVGPQLQLALHLKGGVVVKFDGFSDKHRTQVINPILEQKYGVSVRNIDVCIKGWNWGDVELTNDKLRMIVDKSLAFEVPLSDVAQVVPGTGLKSGKHEVSIEFAQSAEAQRHVDTLAELRLYVPPPKASAAATGAAAASSTTATATSNGGAASHIHTPSKIKKEKKAKKVKTGDGDLDDEDDDDDEEDEAPESYGTAEYLRARIAALSNVHEDAAVAGDKAFIKFDQMLFNVPRGKYDVEMYEKYMTITSAARANRIDYKAVKRIFLLPKPDGRSFVMAVALDPPLRSGAQAYPHILLNLSREETATIDVHLDAEQIKKYEGLKNPMEGLLFKIVTESFAALIGKKPTVPGDFKSGTVAFEVEETVVDESAGYDDEGNPKVLKVVRKEVKSCAVRCQLKSAAGYLFPLERSFFYIVKPPTYVRYDAISNVEFMRISADSTTQSVSRSFELALNMKDGSNISFQHIPRDELRVLVDWCKKKALPILNEKEADVQARGLAEKHRVVAVDGDDDGGALDDEDSEDESFAAASDTDDEDEFMEGAVDEDGSGGGEGAGGGKKKKAKKKAAADEDEVDSDDAGDDSDDEEEKKEKKKKKKKEKKKKEKKKKKEEDEEEEGGGGSGSGGGGGGDDDDGDDDDDDDDDDEDADINAPVPPREARPKRKAAAVAESGILEEEKEFLAKKARGEVKDDDDDDDDE